MRLSEAMRLGAMLKPQGRDYLRRRGRTCALGAACDASGLLPPKGIVLFLEQGKRLWPWRWTDKRALCPAGCPGWRSSVCGVVTHLNDYHYWTREEIADWVATLEPAETPDPHVTTSDVRGTAVRG